MRLSIFLAILMVILANGEKFPRPKSPTVLETITTLTERIAKFKGLTSLDLMREVLLGSPVEGFETEDILKVCQRTFPDQGFDQLVELWEHNKLKKKSPKKPRPIVKTHLGSVQGVTTRGGSGTRYHYFMGLPYASRPERFMSASPPEPWEGIRDASREEVACMQYGKLFESIGGSEDCLYTNVITPQLPEEGAKKLPVVIWIHGGAFKFGTGSNYIHGPEKFMREEVILVSFTYRLGPFGFLCANTKEAPGNIGLKDTVMLLRWVQKNIAAFGGDPDNVTLYGISSGGIFIDLLTMSPMAKGLFHRGITQSGASLASWAFTDSSLKFVFRLGKYLGIDTLNVDEMVSRLKLEDPVDIVSASERIAFDELPIGDYFTFMPCVETEIPGEETFLSDHPENILRSGNFSRMPMMMGYNGREGLSFLEIQQSFPNMLSDLDATFEWMLPEVFLDKWRSPKEKRELVAKVKHFYFGNEKISNATVGEFVDYISDIIFRYGIYRDVRLRLKQSDEPIYFLLFDYDGEYAPLRQFTDVNLPGVSHADDLGYSFNLPYSKIDKGKPETVLASKRFVKLITNFAKYGDPTPKEDSILPIKWTPMRNESRFIYLHQTEDLKMVDTAYIPNFNFWDDIFANYTRNIWPM